MRRLTTNELTRAREALLGLQGPGLVSALFELTMGAPKQPVDDVAAEMADLGWWDGQLTELGWLVSDPVREYGLWKRRAYRLAHTEALDWLSHENFRSLDVLEVGSGGGCNLMSLQGYARSLVGVEPMPVYIQMGEIIARMADRVPPYVVEGSGESLPFEDATFDVAFCFSSHQYMDVRKAMAEIARVLRPSGEVIIVSNFLRPFLFESAARFLHGRRLGTLKYDGVSIVNTLSYQVLGRRAVQGSGKNTTSVPIYPSYRFMRRLLERNGLRADLSRKSRSISGETTLVARKR